MRNFNPRSRVGNDSAQSFRLLPWKPFQSTFPRGERLVRAHGIIKTSLFQSTFPRGERLLQSLFQHLYQHFNPRSRVGNDGATFSLTVNLSISIHVPAWGTTDIATIRKHHIKISIHVPAWGTTIVIPIVDGLTPISIHVPAWGTTKIRKRKGVVEIFQSTFPRGERLQISTIFHLYICISSTNSHFSITSFCIFYLIHFFLICFFQLFMVRIFWGFSVYFWFALYRNNT